MKGMKPKEAIKWMAVKKKIKNIENEVRNIRNLIEEDKTYKRLVRDRDCSVCRYRNTEDGKPCSKKHTEEDGFGKTCKDWKAGIGTFNLPKGTLVRFNEFPDRLYYIEEENIPILGGIYYKLEAIDHSHTVVVQREEIFPDE